MTSSLNTARTYGIIGLAGVAAWLVIWAAEIRGEPDAGSGLWYAAETIAVFAIAATATLFAGLALVRAAGDGRFARLVLWLIPIGLGLIMIGAVANLLTATSNQDADTGGIGLVFPIGGALAGLGSLVGGILIAVRGMLSGVGRWTVLMFAIIYNVHGAVSGEGASSLATTVELIQHLLVGLIAVSLLTVKGLQKTPDTRLTASV